MYDRYACYDIVVYVATYVNCYISLLRFYRMSATKGA